MFVKYGLTERAVDHLRRIFTLEPQHREARERLAAALGQIGRKREAAAELATLAAQLKAGGDGDAPAVAEQALALDPACTEAARILGRRAATPAPPPAAASDDLTTELEQLDFFAQQSLHDEARAVLVDLEQRFPGHPLLGRAAPRVRRGGGTGRHPGRRRAGGARAAPSPSSPRRRTPIRRRTAIWGSPTSRWGFTTRRLRSSRSWPPTRSRAVFAYTMIGECVEAKGELGEAVKRYKEALNLPQATAQESVELYYLLGAVFEQLGDVREALYFFENVGKRDPGFRDVKKRIVALKTPSAREELQRWNPSAIGRATSSCGCRTASPPRSRRPTAAGASARTPGRVRAAAAAARACWRAVRCSRRRASDSPTCTATLRPEMAKALPGEGLDFRAAGLSLIFHPRSPRVPTVHANVRHIQRGARSWFGGGTDLTPYYVVPEDAASFHRTLRDCCARHDAGLLSAASSAGATTTSSCRTGTSRAGSAGSSSTTWAPAPR